VERGAGRTVQQPEAKIELAESSRPAGPRAGQAARALAALALPLPGREVRPGDTWDGTVLIRSEGLTVKAEAEVSLAVQYRYLGRGTRAGREEALVELSGRPASGQDAIGEVFGYALIETTTGRVTLARAHFDVSAPATLPDKTSARVHFSLQAALARAAGTEGPGPDIDLSALPPDHSMILPVFVRSTAFGLTGTGRLGGPNQRERFLAARLCLGKGLIVTLPPARTCAFNSYPSNRVMPTNGVMSASSTGMRCRCLFQTTVPW
jgi:hypothetical protein